MTATFFSLSDLGLETAPSNLVADFLSQLQTSFPSYSPAAGNLEYIIAQIFASWAADLAQYATQGSAALFQTYGTSLIGLPYQQGVAAEAIITINSVDTAGYTLPAGTQVVLDSLGFSTLAPATIAMGDNSVQVTVSAVQTGSSFNGAGSGGSVQLVSQLDWVSAVTLVTAASGGIDAEDDDHYLDRLATTLQLMAPRPITASDFANMTLNFVPDPTTDQEEVGRATAIDGFNPGATSFTANTAASSSTLSGITSFTGISPASGGSPGSVITGSGIPANTTVVTTNTGAGTLVMLNAATASATGVNLTSTGSYGNERTVTVFVTDADGDALNSDTLAATESWLESLREINFIVNVLSPTYIPIYVTCSVHPITGYSSSTVQDGIQANLVSFLSPANWGLPASSGFGWFNYPTIYASKLLATVQGTAGVDYVENLKFGLAASPTNAADLTLYSAAPLPQATTTTIPTSGISII